MFCRLKQDINYKGKDYKVGAIVEFPEGLSIKLVLNGVADKAIKLEENKVKKSTKKK